MIWEYEKAHIQRSVLHRLGTSMLTIVSQLQDRILRDREFFNEYLYDLSINVTEMFQDTDYYQSRHGSVIFDKELSNKIVFADHNLITDTVFADVNLILCRNVLIYFEKTLQEQGIDLF